MRKTGAKPPADAELRRLAEERHRAKQGDRLRVEATQDPERLTHELQVHQIELEMQNDELRRIRDELEASLDHYSELYDFAPVGYVTLDDRSTILEINLAGAAMLGKERSRLVGQRLAPCVTASTRPAFEAFLGALRGTDKASCDVALVGTGGSDLHVHIDGMREKAGQENGWRCRAALMDVTERKAAEGLLQAADRNKTDFLGVLSHELRNPLAPIRNASYLLEHAPAESPQAARAKEVIARQTGHLTRLVDDLLDVTRISHGKIELQREILDVREIVRRTRDDHHSLFEQRGIGLGLDGDAPSPVWVDADRTRLEQVVGNLLQNAAKFTPRGGATHITVAGDNGRAEIRVRDDGVGMEPEQLDRVFEPFVQVASSLARTHGGLGLGLALVKGLVALHGGNVVARSGGRGRGSEFIVSLPLARPSRSPGKAARPGRAVPPRSIVIIEDNADAAATLADVLEFSGHRVEIAVDGRSGIELARKVKPDFVICDVGLPDVDGYEVARALRADRDLRSMRLVALSGYAQPEDKERAKEAGFDEHIAKPPELDELAEMLRSGRDE